MAPLSSTPVEPKGPGESKTYTVDWSTELADGDTLSTTSWALPSGLTKAADGITTDSLATSIQLVGGVADVDYELTNTVVTAAGEILVRTVVLPVRTL